LQSGHSAKVERWKLKLQEFDIDWCHIERVNNEVADCFSRLCTIQSENICLLDRFEIPTEYYTIFRKCHNELVGHSGVERTVDQVIKFDVEKEYDRGKLREFVKRFIRQCPCCQMMSQIKIPIHTHPFTVATYEPFERVNMDYIGPLPPDIHSNMYILVIICCFSCFVELHATKAASAEESARVLLMTIGRFGQPAQILSDNGSHFVNKVITELSQLMGTEKIQTMAYSKEENSIVERENKETMHHLRNIVFDQKIKDK
jgi:hypothetical protein